MNKNNFNVFCVDTDAATWCKKDGSEFTEQELENLDKELNSLFPELIRWDFEFYIPKLIVLKSKNYILDHGDGKIVYKGSSIKTSSKELAMKSLMFDLIGALLENHNDINKLQEIYTKYIIEANNIQDIRRWSSKKTITRAILDCKDFIEQDILDKKIGRAQTEVWTAVMNEGHFEGDKVYLYPVRTISEINRKTLKNGRIKETYKYSYGLKLDKYYDSDNSDFDVEHAVKRCYNTVQIFQEILDVKNIFINYSLTKNQDALQELLQRNSANVLKKQ